MLKITMKDGAVREAEAGISIQDFVKQVSNSLAKKVLAAKVDGETKDLTMVLDKDCKVEFLTFDDEGLGTAPHGFPHPRTGRQAPLQGCQCAPGHRPSHREWLLL